jgi:hypothetical protein
MPRWIRFFVLSFIVLMANTDFAPIGPLSYPQGINPLTGLPVADPSMLDRRPLLIKISNFPPYVRPQSGLNSADIVWEHLLAGGVTRFTAVFLGSDVDHVGPIRSARLIDFHLTRIYEGLFVYSGMAEGTLDRMRQDAVLLTRAVGGSSPCPALCRFRQEGLAEEHTLYGDTQALRELAVDLGRDVEPDTLGGMAFAAETPGDGTPIRGIHIGYRETVVTWQFDAEMDRWLRSQDGQPHIDANDQQQISAANIILLEADHIEQDFTYDGYWGPPNYAFDVDLTGSGRLFLLRDGHYFEGEWRREDEDAPLTFHDLHGAALALKPGNTYINLVPRWVGGFELKFLLEQPLRAVVTFDGGVNLRVGPGTQHGTPDVAYGGDTFNVIGRDRAGEWIQLLLPNDYVLWVSTAVVEVDGDIMQLPVPRATIE